ncbi:MAG TPA: putative oxidoreductase C-terminal domain-containing protein [Gemmataceae bacterium]|jgi:predicted dehydrogenase|nr:putative oxidoreductase C-terminal domain-containing protein [Gemmataceae bacterium]
MPEPVRLCTLAPGHFHAALVQKEALPSVDSRTHVYGPLDFDLIAHLDRIARFNARDVRPTNWTTTVHAGDDWFERFRAERPGNTVVIAGRNRPKIDLILAAVSAGYCVLADKPWIVDAADFPKVESMFVEAERNGVFAWDIMTERFEITNRLQRELMHNVDVFGTALPGTADEPGLELESVHYLSKHVAGVPLRRPAWWFDPAIAGEALTDVGTHLADLAIWLQFPDEAIALADIEIVAAERWPTAVGVDEFRQITGLPDVPPELAHLRDGHSLTYWGNNSATVRIRDRIFRLVTRWGVRANSPDGDTHRASARGTRSTIAIQHEAGLGSGPQLLVIPTKEKPGVLAAIKNACRQWSAIIPGFEANDLGDRIHIRIPASERTGHESHFAHVLAEFVAAFQDRSKIPATHQSNLLAKYHMTTHAVSWARQRRQVEEHVTVMTPSTDPAAHIQ